METQHQVTLTKGFYLVNMKSLTPMYAAVMAGVTGDQNASPSNWHGYPNRPVERVSWDDVQVFLKRLNDQQAANIPAYVTFFPWTMQWEYACRAGTGPHIPGVTTSMVRLRTIM